MARFGLGRGGVGLDVGTSAVRAVEVGPGNQPNVTKFGQVLLPRGAVRDGIVEDPAAVAAAINTLWRRVGFAARTVRIGVANKDVVTRKLQFPSMPRDEIEGAIRLQAQDQMPIPLADAVIDFELADEYIGPEGQALIHVFVVAAQRGMVDALLEAIRIAKLRPAVLEFNAYPLVRSLAADALLSASSEAIVDIGASVTNVVVQQAGKVRFVRSLDVGGDDFTETVSATLNVDWEEAESLKHSAGSALAIRLAPGGAEKPTDEDDTGDDVMRAVEALVPQAQRFVEEIRGSLDYYNTTPDALPVGRLVVVGGGSLLGGLLDRLAASLRVDVERGQPLAKVQVGKVKLSPDQIEAAEPFLAVATGLALGALEA